MEPLDFYTWIPLAIYCCILTVGYFYTENDTNTRRRDNLFIYGTLLLLLTISVAWAMIGYEPEQTLGLLGMIVFSIMLFRCDTTIYHQNIQAPSQSVAMTNTSTAAGLRE